MPDTRLLDLMREIYHTYTAQEIGDAIRRIRLELELYTPTPTPVKKPRVTKPVI